MSQPMATPKIPPSRPMTPASTVKSQPDVTISSAEGLQDTDLAAALKNRHHERIDDAE